ncbi:hypothetical protein CVT24_001134 [Panaeolus cyanescens]|uniref:Uncharacterized protein n=1 Tax=Panaeolus cyanescens TaxID=181874 RepID=A0A409W6Q8_9AGAR|nr:hypothetical protein CVT24_001134 [Panaeolus cyanescens]
MSTLSTFQPQTAKVDATPPSKAGTPVSTISLGRDGEPVYIHNTVEKAYIGWDGRHLEPELGSQDYTLPADVTAKIDPNGRTPISTFHAAVLENATREIRDLVENTRTAANDVSETVRALQAEHITFRILIETLMRQLRTVYTVPYHMTSRSRSPTSNRGDALYAEDADVSDSTHLDNDTRDAESNGSIISRLTSDFYSDPEEDHSWNSFTQPSQSIVMHQTT